MAGAKLERTQTSGIYRREGDRGTRYVVVYRDSGGKQRKETAATLEEARALKRRRERGDANAAGRLTFADYSRDWLARHPARESTRSDYGKHLERWIIPFIGERRKLSDVSPLLVNQFIAHLAGAEGSRGPLADSTIATVLTPLRSCMGQAVREGLIPHNPTRDLRLPNRATVDDDDEHDDVRALAPDQLATVLELVPARHRLFFRFLAATGLRFSEAIGVQWQHLHLDGGSPHVKVRRAIVRGRLEPPKTRHGRRDVPLSPALVDELRAHRKGSEWPRDKDLVFPGMTGQPINYGNLRSRVLVPVGQEAGVPWMTFHTFRHTCASMLFDQGRNAKQVQRWLGHHSAAFTLETYIHLLTDELDAPLELPVAPPSPRDGTGDQTGQESGSGPLRGS